MNKKSVIFSSSAARASAINPRIRGREIENTGDSLLATFDGPARAISAAGAIVALARRPGFEVKAGLRTGECEVVADRVSGTAE